MWNEKSAASSMPTDTRATGTGDRGRLPRLTGIEALTDGARLHLEVPADLAWFAGHFPGEPVLPGIAQISWAIQFARELLGHAHDPVSIERVKFLATVPLEVPLILELHGDASVVDWLLAGAGQTCSRGRLRF